MSPSEDTVSNLSRRTIEIDTFIGEGKEILTIENQINNID
jgi:hypothetical protein